MNVLSAATLTIRRSPRRASTNRDRCRCSTAARTSPRLLRLRRERARELNHKQCGADDNSAKTRSKVEGHRRSLGQDVHQARHSGTVVDGRDPREGGAPAKVGETRGSSISPVRHGRGASSVWVTQGLRFPPVGAQCLRPRGPGPSGFSVYARVSRAGQLAV